MGFAVLPSSTVTSKGTSLISPIFSPAAIAGLLALCGPTVAGGESPESRPHTLEIGEKDFLLDGNPFVLRCGEVHYARIPHEYWRHRLKMLRAMGCNAVGCYMFWNFRRVVWLMFKDFNWGGTVGVTQ